MTILYYGLNCFRLQANGLSLLIDPFDEKVGLTLPRMQNDILLLSQAEGLAKKSGEKTMIIRGPGEYEVQGCFIYGWPVAGEGVGQTLYLIEAEGIKIVYLGLLHKEKLTEEQLEKLEEADILMVPVGGGESLNSAQAATLVNDLEPRIVIPMYYQLPGLKLKLEGVEKFKKELGAKSEEVDKLKISKKELPQEEIRLTIIQPSD